MSSRPALAALVVATAAIAATTTLSLPAAATTRGIRAGATDTGPATGPVESVSLSLAPRDRASLTALATAKGLSDQVRQVRLDAALPGAARAADVAQRAAALGLTVTGTSAFSVHVQAPASRVLALFGSARAHNRSLPTAQTLPQLPSNLAGLVDVAVGGDDTRPALLSHALRAHSPHPSSAIAPSDNTLSVAQARGISRISTTTGTPSVPPGSDQTVGAPIVASLQFPSPSTQSGGGISATLSDLHSFATTNRIYGGSDFPAAEVSTVNVSSCTDNQTYNNDQTPDEVALDQEALLVTAPQLRQRIYYAPNCGSGQPDAVQQVYNDVVTNNLPIVALSTSWGECEPQANAYLSSDQTVISALLAKGVQLFAAAGDAGSFDCVGDPTNGDSVDDPGSVPGVISVGGTQGLTLGSLATWNDGSNATGGGFSCVGGSYTNPANGQTTSISGFTRPGYQSAVQPPSYPTNGFRCNPSTAGARAVPDLAMASAEGLDVVVNEDPSCSSDCKIYGTSLSAPLAAGGYAQTLANAAKSRTDVASAGGLPAVIYASAAGATNKGVVDVVRGNNGDYAAGSGWDPTTGLGTPQWPTLIRAITGASVAPNNNVLNAGDTLTNSNPRRTSPSGNAFLQIQPDGNVVLYDAYAGGAVPIWTTNTYGNPNSFLVFQGDGNIVVYNSKGQPTYNAATYGAGLTSLQVLDDGTVAGLTGGGLPVWVNGARTGYTATTVPSGGSLAPGQSLSAGAWTAAMQSNGQLVVGNGSASYALPSSGAVAGSSAHLNPDGSFVIRSTGATTFSAGTQQNPYSTLSLDANGRLSITAPSGALIWSASPSTPGGARTGNSGTSLTPSAPSLPAYGSLWSADGSLHLVLQGDGNLVLYRASTGQPLWFTGTSGYAPGQLVLQGDGNLVLYSANGRPLFQSGTSGRAASFAVQQTDGNFVLYGPRGALWSWMTGRIG